MRDYRFYNANPLGEIEKDCVCRAICGATNIPYKEVEEKLHLIAELHDCDWLCVCCYHKLLEDVFGLKPTLADGQTVGDIACHFNDRIVLIRTDGHLTHSRYGIVYDAWYCTECTADMFWVVE